MLIARRAIDNQVQGARALRTRTSRRSSTSGDVYVSISDTGCNQHITNTASHYSHAIQACDSIVEGFNGAATKVSQRGDIAGDITHTNVLCVPSADDNLSSTGKFADEGYTSVYHKEGWLMVDWSDMSLQDIKKSINNQGGSIVYTGERDDDNGLYMLKTTKTHPRANRVTGPLMRGPINNEDGITLCGTVAAPRQVSDTSQGVVCGTTGKDGQTLVAEGANPTAAVSRAPTASALNRSHVGCTEPTVGEPDVSSTTAVAHANRASKRADSGGAAGRGATNHTKVGVDFDCTWRNEFTSSKAGASSGGDQIPPPRVEVVNPDGAMRRDRERAWKDEERKHAPVHIPLTITRSRTHANLAASYRGDLSDFKLWHGRYAHMGAATVKLGHPDIKGPSVLFCDGCVRGKAHAHAFLPVVDSIDYLVGEHISSDGHGYFVRCIHGFRYRYLYVDKATGFTWISPVVDQSEQPAALRGTIADARARSGRQLKVFKSDGYSTYTSNEVRDFLDSTGARLELSAAHAQQQNGVSERLNRTIDELAASVMAHAGDAPARFWSEAMNYVVFTRNNVNVHETKKGSGVLVSRRCLFEGHMHKFDERHLRPWGCLCYAYITKLSGDRTGPYGPTRLKSLKGFFIGYALDKKAYRVWIPESQKVKEVAFQHSVCHEGIFPWRSSKNWTPEEVDEPAHYLLHGRCSLVSKR